ncbi:MAG TPA: hypothetical protein VFH73_06535 [Polyangia bacterium]|jgi:hypothetical protein|nr:hypothetical protein [Polyangia bacterium]
MSSSRKRPVVALAGLVLATLCSSRADAQPPPAPIEEPAPRRYGDRGTSEIAVGLGYSSVSGFLAAGGFRYFVIDKVAPGFEGTYVRGGSSVPSYGLALASLRFVPVQSSSVALLLTGRTGRMFLANHADGWGLGAGAGILIPVGGGAGIEIGYEFLRLLPASFCADLSTCVLHGLVLGIRFSF